MFSAGAGVFFPEPEFFLPEPEPEVKNPEFAQHYLKFVTRISIVQSSEQAPFSSEIVGLILTLDS